MADEPQIKVGDNLGGFEILEKIAEGGMGTVYKARQISLDRIVAIKILPPRLAGDEQFVRHFQEESRVAARLKHPHLIEVYDAGKSDGTHFFVMEFVEGETVGAKLRRDGPFVEHTAVGICMNVAQALQYTWEKAKLIHGDIKPENLLIERDTKKVRIGDLGLGKSLLDRSEEDPADQRHAMGTPAYVCPEQARGERRLDFRADMYALGATFYQMLTGKLPFDGLSPAEVLAGHLQGTLTDPRKIRPGISDATVVVLERMMAKEPDLRYPSWAALAHDLTQIHDGRSPSVPPLPPGRSTIHRESHATVKPPPRKTSPLRIAIEVGLILAALAAAFWYFRIRPNQPVSPALPPQPAVAPSSPPSPGQQPSVVAPSLGAPAAASFQPSDIAGLQCWLSADKAVAHDEQNHVSSWGDQSGHGVDAHQTDISAMPLYVPNAIHRKPALRFDGKADRLRFAPIDVSEFTVSIVFSMTALKPWAGPLNNRVARHPGFQIVSGDRGTAAYVPAIVLWNGTDEVARKKATSSLELPLPAMVHTWTYDGASGCRFYLDGVETELTDAASTWESTGASIGRGFDFMAGDIAEIVLYGRALPPSERHDLESYLETKYGITPSRLASVVKPAPTATKPVSSPTPPASAPDQQAAAAKAKGEAEERYAAWYPTFQALLTAGEFAKAKEAAVAAQAQPSLAPVKDKLAHDLQIPQLILKLRETAFANLLGQTYFVGSTPGTVVRLESDKFWVKLSAGEIAVPFDKVDPSKIPTFALSKNRDDAELNLAAGLYSWYRGEKEIARTYFDTARKAGADVSAYLPSELTTPTPSPTAPSEPATEAPAKAPSEAAKPPPLGRIPLPPDDGQNMLANHSFEQWSGKVLVGWSMGGSQARPSPDTADVIDGQYAARYDFGPNQQSMSLEQPVQVSAGYNYRLTFFYRSRGLSGQVWAEIGSPGDPIPKLKQPITDNSEWQMVTVEFNSPSAATVMVRVRASNASGTLWLDHFDLRQY